MEHPKSKHISPYTARQWFSESTKTFLVDRHICRVCFCWPQQSFRVFNRLGIIIQRCVRYTYTWRTLERACAGTKHHHHHHHDDDHDHDHDHDHNNNNNNNNNNHNNHNKKKKRRASTSTSNAPASQQHPAATNIAQFVHVHLHGGTSLLLQLLL